MGRAPLHRKQVKVENIKFTLPSMYEPLSLIGNGQLSVVCSAYRMQFFDNHGVVSLPCAIKKLTDVTAYYDDSLQALREVHMLRSLRHRNVISLVDALTPCDDVSEFRDLYLVMPLLDGNIATLLATGPQLTEVNVKVLMYQLLCALHYVHSAGVAHNNVRPSNLLVSAHGYLVLADFGRSRCFSELVSPMLDGQEDSSYMAPELLLGVAPVNARCDMWAAGCVMAELLLRTTLFDAASIGDQLERIFASLHVTQVPASFETSDLSDHLRQRIDRLGASDPTSLASLLRNREASEDLIDVVTRLLSVDPDTRMTAEEALAHPFFAAFNDPHSDAQQPATQLVSALCCTDDKGDHISIGKIRKLLWKAIHQPSPVMMTPQPVSKTS